MKILSAFYLFPDRHAVAVYEQTVKGIRIEFSEIYECWTDPTSTMDFKGRIVFHRYSDGIVNLTKKARGIRTVFPSIEHGSNKTKELGIPVGHLSIWGKSILGEIQFDTMPSILSSKFTIQPDSEWHEIFNPAMSYWGTTKVSKIHYKKS